MGARCISSSERSIRPASYSGAAQSAESPAVITISGGSRFGEASRTASKNDNAFAPSPVSAALRPPQCPDALEAPCTGCSSGRPRRDCPARSPRHAGGPRYALDERVRAEVANPESVTYVVGIWCNPCATMHNETTPRPAGLRRREIFGTRLRFQSTRTLYSAGSSATGSCAASPSGM